MTSSQPLSQNKGTFTLAAAAQLSALIEQGGSSSASPTWSRNSNSKSITVIPRVLSQVAFIGAFVVFRMAHATVALANESAEASESTEEEGGLPKEAQIILAIILVCLTAVFAGLTMGIMGQSTLTLEIIAEGGTEPECSYAKKLLPIRRMGHHALCTLVLGNMWANVMIAQFCADVNPEGGGGEADGAAGFIAFAMSTLIILIFGEILPMAVCKSSQALRIAAAGVPILQVFIVLLYPFAKPLGWALDKLIHHKIGQIYDRNELIKLMSLHSDRLGAKSGMDQDEGNILIGVLEFREKTIGAVMTPIEDTICVSEDCLIDRHLLKALWATGRSRTPVVKGTSGHAISVTDPLSQCTSAMKQNIVGILYIKDLITYNVAGTTVGQYLRSEQQREVRHVITTDTLPKVMGLAQTGVAHMFIVRDSAPSGYYSEATTPSKSPHLTPSSEHMMMGPVVGICTMEDVLEALIKSKIYNDNDNFGCVDEVEMSSKAVPQPSGVVPARDLCDYVAGEGNTCGAAGRTSSSRRAKASRINFYSFHIPFASIPKGATTHKVAPLTEVERMAVAKYLINAVPAFATWRREVLSTLLTEAKDDVLLPCVGNPLAAIPTAASAAAMQLGASLGGSLRFGGASAPAMLASSFVMPTTPYSVTPASPDAFLLDLPEKNIIHRMGVATTDFVLVLTGCVDVCFGGSDGFRSEITTMGFVGESILLDGQPFVPNFAARVTKRPTRLLRISLELFRAHEARLQFTSASSAAAATTAAINMNNNYNNTKIINNMNKTILSRSDAKSMMAEESRRTTE